MVQSVRIFRWCECILELIAKATNTKLWAEWREVEESVKKSTPPSPSNNTAANIAPMNVLL